MGLMREHLAVLAAVAMVLAGCSTHATVTRVNGNELDVKFAGSDRDNIYVRTGGETHAIPRKNIAEIDHPGDTAAVMGAILAGYGALNIGVGAGKCESEGAAFCAGVFTPAKLVCQC